MKFGPWYPLAEAAQHAPAAAGLFQVRLASGLLDYPTGRSAMVHYGWSDSDLRAEVLAFAAALRPRRSSGPASLTSDVPLLCRHGEEMTAGELRYPRAAHDRLREQFIRRFGAPPGTLTQS